MDYKGCVVVQGATYDFTIPKIKERWYGYQIIFSTWNDTDKSLYSDTDIVVYSNKPQDPGPMNFYYQKVSTIAGLDKAKEFGWDRVVKWRSDLVPKSADSVWSSFQTDKLNLYSWINVGIGYVADYFMEGEIEDIRTMFDTDCDEFPEKNITKELFKSNLKEKVNFTLKEIQGDSDIYFERKDFWLSENLNKSDYFGVVIPDEWAGYKILE
jgi:hypothetical protein